MPEKIEFLPFHAINEFMRPDFRLAIIRETLTAQSALPDTLANTLNHQIKSLVSIPGFRNSEKAPAFAKVLPTSKAFEKNPDLVAAILACWTELNPSLRSQVFQLLETRGWRSLTGDEGLTIETLSQEILASWPIFPENFNRTGLPGFYPLWPKGDDFESLYKAFTELYPDVNISIDKVSLMVVWISMRLPYHIEEGEEEKTE